MYTYAVLAPVWLQKELIMWHCIGFGVDHTTIENIVGFKGFQVSKNEGTKIKSVARVEVGRVQQQALSDSQTKTQEVGKSPTTDSPANGKPE